MTEDEVILDTPRLRLRAPVPEDAGALEALFADEEAMRGAGGPRPPGFAAGWIVTEASWLARDGVGIRVVELRATGELIGCAGLSRRAAPGKTSDAELDVRLLGLRQGQGLGSEAAAAVLVHAFSALRLLRVDARAEPGDGACIRMLERVGLRYERLELGPGGARQVYALQRP